MAKKKQAPRTETKIDVELPKNATIICEQGHISLAQRTSPIRCGVCGSYLVRWEKPTKPKMNKPGGGATEAKRMRAEQKKADRR